MLIIKDRVKEYTSTTGLSPFVVEGPDPSFISFSSVCQNSDTFYYCIAHRSENQWEIGKGEYQATGINRIGLLSSSTGSFVDFLPGGKDIFITQPASILDVLTRSTGPIVLGRSQTTEGIMEQLTPSALKTMLNIQISDVSNVISSNPNNRATLSSGVYVPEVTLDIAQIYNSSKI